MFLSLVAFAAAGTQFTVGEILGQWRFISPEGIPFWSLAVCCTGPGSTKKDYNPKNPSYASFKLFPSDKAWVENTLDKLTNNGFNSLGGWSDTRLFRQYGGEKRLPYFEVLHLGAYHRAPWEDMFSAEHERIIQKAAKDQIEKIKDDPYLVGYFSDNELGWWREALFLAYLKMKPSAPGRKRFVEFVTHHYKGNWAAFKKDWTTKQPSFDKLDPNIRLKTGQGGMRVVKAWQSYLTDHYYRQMKTAIRKYDPDRLILGDRYCQFYYPNVAQAATPYVDVISTNYGADWNSGELTEYFLASLHQITKKPVLITEFYMAAMENRSGNKNSSGGFPVVKTQRDRERAVKTYLADLARRPYVVGAHWFQFWDEPTHGRGDGENYNMGLVDIHGKDYEGLMRVFREFKLGESRAPDFKKKLPLEGRSPKGGMKGWPRSQALIKPSSGPAFADLYVFGSGDHLLVGLAAMTFTDEAFYPGKRVPEKDRAQLALTINGVKHWVRFGGNKRSCTTDAKSNIAYWRDGVRSELLFKIPKPKGNLLTIQAALTTHGGADKMTWLDRRELSTNK
jgi:hypothetical protein